MQTKDKTAINLAVAVHEDDMATRWMHDDIAVEVPVALVYNYISHAVMMASPNDLQDFALGFSLTENIRSAMNALKRCVNVAVIWLDVPVVVCVVLKA